MVSDNVTLKMIIVVRHPVSVSYRKLKFMYEILMK